MPVDAEHDRAEHDRAEHDRAECVHRLHEPDRDRRADVHARPDARPEHDTEPVPVRAR